MPAYSFMEEFAIPVAEGLKRTTIRRRRKNNSKPQHDVTSHSFTSGTPLWKNYEPDHSKYTSPFIGQRMVFYRGMCTKNCTHLRETTLVNHSAIQIFANGQIFLNGQPLDETKAMRLARMDGFLTIEAMIAFFKKKYDLPFGDKHPADLLQWKVETQDEYWYNVGWAEHQPHLTTPYLKTNCNRLMVYEGPFSQPLISDTLPWLMHGLPKNWKRMSSDHQEIVIPDKSLPRSGFAK